MFTWFSAQSAVDTNLRNPLPPVLVPAPAPNPPDVRHIANLHQSLLHLTLISVKIKRKNVVHAHKKIVGKSQRRPCHLFQWSSLGPEEYSNGVHPSSGRKPQIYEENIFKPVHICHWVPDGAPDQCLLWQCHVSWRPVSTLFWFETLVTKKSKNYKLSQIYVHYLC